MPRAPEPERGFIKAVGRAATKSVSPPQSSDGCGEPVFGAFDERFIYVHFLHHASDDEGEDDAEEDDVGNECAHRVHRLFLHLREAPNGGCHQQAHAAKYAQEDGLQKVDALVDADDDDAHQGGYEGG